METRNKYKFEDKNDTFKNIYVYNEKFRNYTQNQSVYSGG